MSTLKNFLEKIPTWGKWLGGLVAAIAAIISLVGYVDAGVYWQNEADADKKALEEHHDDDIKQVLELIAKEKRVDRIGRNRRELKRLERDYIAGRYANEDEREFMKEEILDLKKAIRCDEEGVC